jgi:transcriptional repressor NrdR
VKCPHCGKADSRVIDTRAVDSGIRRRRRCQACGQRFTTYEQWASNDPLVVKDDGRREEFDRNKLLAGVRKACAKRPIASEDIERLVDQVECQVYALGRTEVKSKIIGEMVLAKLKHLDEIAYIRFASVYLPLADLESIKREVDRLLKRRQAGT